MTIKVLEVTAGEKYCVEFSRSAGDQLVFFEEFLRLRDGVADLANASAC